MGLCVKCNQTGQWPCYTQLLDVVWRLAVYQDKVSEIQNDLTATVFNQQPSSLKLRLCIQLCSSPQKFIFFKKSENISKYQNSPLPAIVTTQLSLPYPDHVPCAGW